MAAGCYDNTRLQQKQVPSQRDKKMRHMTNSARDAFLQRVNQALQQSNRPGVAADVPARGNVGYQGAGADPIVRFRDELMAAGGHAYLVRDASAAVNQAIELTGARSVRQALLGRGPFIDTLDLSARLRQELAIEVIVPEESKASDCRESFFAADIGIT